MNERIAQVPAALNEPSKTVIRSLDELYQQMNKKGESKLGNGLDDQFYGWAPDIQVLSDSDLKKLEKQEERN